MAAHCLPCHCAWCLAPAGNVSINTTFGSPNGYFPGIQRCLRCDVPGGTPNTDTCNVCYNPTTRERFWGFVTILVRGPPCPAPMRLRLRCLSASQLAVPAGASSTTGPALRALQ